ncbi:MAG TPA: hypothetical protein VKT82_33275 [Ktedonobacterales bacterium]|nr:hypothetical protein [Ktedonobacterales bacterium]
MNQALIETLAEIGVALEATDTYISIRAIDQARLRVAAHAQWVELAAMVRAAGFSWDELEAMGQAVEYGDEYHFVLRTVDQQKLTAARKAAEVADFHHMVMQAEAAWEEAEAAEPEYD